MNVKKNRIKTAREKRRIERAESVDKRLIFVIILVMKNGKEKVHHEKGDLTGCCGFGRRVSGHRIADSHNSNKITFSSETRERVLEAARQLNYQLPVRKKASAQAGLRMLLVLTPTLTNQYYSEIIQTIEEYADSLDYRVIVCNTFRKPELEKFYLNTFVGARVDGLIYTFLPSFPRQVEKIADTLPTVIIGEKQDELSVCSIELRNVTAGALLAEHLYQLGHRRMVFISTPFNQLSLARSQRLEGIRRQLESHGVRDGLEVLSAERSAEADTLSEGLPYEYNVGRALTAELIRRRSKATALIGVNDMTALGILAQLNAQGIRVPGEVSVCGFDNVFSSAITTPSSPPSIITCAPAARRPWTW